MLNNKSILKPKLEKLVKDKEKMIIEQQIIPWVLGFARKRLKIKKFDGTEISYEGVEYEGTPSQVFWSDSYIKPFLEDITLKIMQEIIKECIENSIKLETELQTLSSRMKDMYTKVYQEMASSDRLMRGKGYPQEISLRDVSQEISNMNDFLDQQIGMELEKNSKRRGIQELFSRIWKDPVWSTIIATGILSAIYFIYSNCHNIRRGISIIF